MPKYTRNIGVKKDIYEELENKKSPGQSFTGVIQELIDKAEKWDSVVTLANLKKEEEVNETLNDNCKPAIQIEIRDS